ncbi:Rds2p [Sugiyamaella lignohabitans]|uniref:Rds2p n=1 Tax=Sugiyamaella lignohabitans TaxID=796027 RepID=A0A167DTA1_9ASCO|nr:Rds2p [Sugiyamaella lignohabitans]ANB13270.1 Rds2p [Sugiyamaella lignohabitans]
MADSNTDNQANASSSSGGESAPASSTPHSSNATGAKRNRRNKVDHACVYCRRSHMTCDDKRPCTRCIKRSIGHLCHDEVKSTKREGSVGTSAGTPPNKRKSSTGVDEEATFGSVSTTPSGAHTVLSTGSGSQHLLLSSTQLELNNSSNRNNSADVISLGQQWGESNPSSGTNLLNQSMAFGHNPVFFSEQAGSEFSSLNDFLSMIDDPSLIDNNLLGTNQQQTSQGFGDISGVGNVDASRSIGSSNGNSGNSSGTASANGNNPSANVSDSARDKFFLTAADPSEDISPEERLKQVIHAKVEAGLLQPFNYANGYTRLQKYMDNYMNFSSKQRILKPLTVFRPAFRGVAQSLTDTDLVLVEEAFERMLLDYDRVFTSMAIPACLWRRTGEIYRGNKEFAGLVGVNVEDLRDGKFAIYELMSEESAVSYWEKYGNIAFDSGQKAVLTSCNLRTRDGRKRRACCFSFTVRRDRYNIPSCIIGNFIPIHH